MNGLGTKKVSGEHERERVKGSTGEKEEGGIRGREEWVERTGE